MVTKENKLGPPPKIYWTQVPGNKCVEFIIVHFQRISAGCGHHVTWESLGLAAQNHLRKLLFFLQVSVTKCLVHVPNGPWAAFPGTVSFECASQNGRACFIYWFSQSMLGRHGLSAASLWDRLISSPLKHIVLLLHRFTAVFPWLAETDVYLIQGVKRC